MKISNCVTKDLFICIVIVATGTAAAAAAAAAAEAGGGSKANNVAAFHVPTGERQLFLDNYGIASIRDLTRTMHKPTKKGAVICPDPVKGGSFWIHTAPFWVPEEKVFKVLVGSTTGPTRWYVSVDGLRWTAGQKPNQEKFSVVYDTRDPDPARRYKGLSPDTWHGDSWHGECTGGFYVSPDGIDWTRIKFPGVPSQDMHSLSFDERGRMFLLVAKRRGPYGRAHGLLTSTDFENWTEPMLVFEADDLDQKIGLKNIEARRADTSLQQVVSDDPSYYNVDIYNMGVFRYESLYIGTPVMYHATGPSADGNNTDGFKLIQLSCSRDLKHWQRVADRKTFLGPSLLGSGAYDLTGLLGPSRAVIRGDELWFYYTGAKYRRPPTRAEPDAGAVCLAVLRRDGFVSLDSGQQAGTMLTRPFKLHGDKLFVNVDAPQGELRVEAIDHHGRVVARSEPLQGDLLGALVNWTQGDLEDLKGQSVCLRFTSREAQLYSYWVENSLVKN